MAEVSFKGGDKLKAAVNKILEGANKASSVAIGFQNGAQEDDGTSVALVAALNEYGGKNRPPRPFFRIAIEKNKTKWPRNLATALKNNGYDASISLGLLGAEIKGEIEDSIKELIAPPLAQSTIDRKGFSKPLIDTGTMLRNVTSQVESK